MLDDGRFIPAPAGNTLSTRVAQRGQTVHPRACGEHALPPIVSPLIAVHPRACGEHLASCNMSASPGSSPRLRGTLLSHDCVGDRAVHPRACGEHWQRQPRGSLRRFIPAPAGNTSPSLINAHAHCGSSPRLRGTRLASDIAGHHRRFIPAPAGNTACARLCASIDRFIPAPAGNTPACQSVQRHTGSSPRLRGTPPARLVTHAVGSSPRLRGTRCAIRRISRSIGSSPRLRGTLDPNAFAAVKAVHPRACGEHNRAQHAAHIGCGSSPRLRGTPLASSLTSPADAGSSPRLRGTLHACLRSRSVHPRACGEHVGRDWASDQPVHPRACGEHADRAT